MTAMLSSEDKGSIQALYRGARNKKQQLGILAQLYDCRKADILEALGLEGAQKAEKKKPKPRAKRWKSAAAKLAACRRVLEDGKSCSAVAREIGVSHTAVCMWVKEYKKAEAENGQTGDIEECC